MKKLLKNIFQKDSCTATFRIGKPKNLTATDNNNDGFAVYNLYTNNDAVLEGLDITQYTVHYFESEKMAIANTAPLEEAWNYYNIKPHTEILYVRVTDIKNPSAYAVDSFTITAIADEEVNKYELLF